MLSSYLRVCGCQEEKCVSDVPACGWVSGGEMCLSRTCVKVGVGRRNVLASYLRVNGCLEERVSLVPICRPHNRGNVVLYSPFVHV